MPPVGKGSVHVVAQWLMDAGKPTLGPLPRIKSAVEIFSSKRPIIQRQCDMGQPGCGANVRIRGQR